MFKLSVDPRNLPPTTTKREWKDVGHYLRASQRILRDEWRRHQEMVATYGTSRFAAREKLPEYRKRVKGPATRVSRAAI
jgi:hypothetical protein